MDVNAGNFWDLLPNLLLMIACSDYIAIDMEMSGIKVEHEASGDEQLPEDVYKRARAVASAYQPLQLGLTCIRRQEQNGPYQSFTFTIPISPMFAAKDKLSTHMAEAVDRKITFSYQTLLFLQKNGFDFEKTLRQGVPYLSREELNYPFEELLQEKTYERAVDSAELTEWGRRTGVDAKVRGFVDNGKENDILELLEPDGGILRYSTRAKYFQLIRERYPTCRCWYDSKSRVMKVKFRKEDVEEKRTEAKEKGVQDAMREQLGLSWIIEALMDTNNLGSLEDAALTPSPKSLDPSMLRSLGENLKEWPEDPERQWREIIWRLKHHSPVLIGHNFLYDLCFLYSTFIGKLPKGLARSRSELRGSCPRIIDTKVLLASPKFDLDIIDHNLEQAYKGIEDQNWPHVGSVPGWTYHRSLHGAGGSPRAHNAGFDSYMTAMLFLKVSARQMMLQDNRRLHCAAVGDPVPDGRWYDEWLEDPAKGDPSLVLNECGNNDPLPNFYTTFFKPVRNRLRMASANIMRLESRRQEALLLEKRTG